MWQQQKSKATLTYLRFIVIIITLFSYLFLILWTCLLFIISVFMTQDVAVTHKIPFYHYFISLLSSSQRYKCVHMTITNYKSNQTKPSKRFKSFLFILPLTYFTFRFHHGDNDGYGRTLNKEWAIWRFGDIAGMSSLEHVANTSRPSIFIPANQSDVQVNYFTCCSLHKI